MNLGFRITEIFVFIATDPVDKSEGIPSFKIGDMWMPLVAADRDRVDSLRTLADHICQSTPGLKMRLVHFTKMEELEEF